MNIVEQLKRDEGCRPVKGGLSDYRDSKGLWTRGYGHLIVPQPRPGYVPRVITVEEAEQLLERDIREHEAELHSAMPWVRAEPEIVRLTLLNMVFNMGVYRLQGFRNFLVALRLRDYPMAAIEGLDSKWHREDVGPRAVRLMKQLIRGELL